MLAGRNGARGRIRTRTGDVLAVVPLHWATRAEGNGASSRGRSGSNSLQKKSAGRCVEARKAEFRLAA